MSPIQRSCDGFNAPSRSSRNAGVATLDSLALRGEWTRLTSEYGGDGLTSTAPSSGRVDRQGLTVDFLLGEHRDIAAAKRFFKRAIEQHGPPMRITLDGCPATHAAVAELKQEGVLPCETKIRASKYLNNIVGQDHRRVKQRIYPMLGFKSLANAGATISGMELVQKVREGQFDMAEFKSRAGGRVPQVWEAVLAA